MWSKCEMRPKCGLSITDESEAGWNSESKLEIVLVLWNDLKGRCLFTGTSWRRGASTSSRSTGGRWRPSSGRGASSGSAKSSTAVPTTTARRWHIPSDQVILLQNSNLQVWNCGFISNPGREPTFWEFARAIIDERWSGNHWDPGRNIECCSENFNKRLQDYRIMELARAAFNVTPLRSTLSAASARWNTTSFSSSRTTATRSATCCGPWDWVPQLSRGGKTGESGRQRRIRFCYFLV